MTAPPVERECRARDATLASTRLFHDDGSTVTTQRLTKLCHFSSINIAPSKLRLRYERAILRYAPRGAGQAVDVSEGSELGPYSCTLPRMEEFEQVMVQDASRLLGISEGAVRKCIARGTLEHEGPRRGLSPGLSAVEAGGRGGAA